MDKCVVNNQIVLMRKIVRSAKRFTLQKLHKNIKNIEKKLGKSPGTSNERLSKMKERKQVEIAAVKKINVDNVSKSALMRTEPWESLIKSSKATYEEKAVARVANVNEVQKAVKKFREDTPNWLEWLPSLIELWQEKVNMKQQRGDRKKRIPKHKEVYRLSGFVGDSSATDDKSLLFPTKSQEKTVKVPSEKEKSSNQIKPKRVLRKNMIIKEIKLDELETSDDLKTEENIDFADTVDKVVSDAESDSEVEEKDSQPEAAHRGDAFFLGTGADVDSDQNNDDDENGNEDVKDRRPHSHERFSNRSKPSFIKRDSRSGTKFGPSAKFSPSTKSFDRKPTGGRNFRGPPANPNDTKVRNFRGPQTKPDHPRVHPQRTGARDVAIKAPKLKEEVATNLHPSWEAKRKAKEKLIIDMNSAPKGKKIKFD